MNEAIEIFADRISVSGPRIDGGWKITLDVGEYEQGKVAQLLTIPQQTTVKVVVSRPPTLETMDAASAVTPQDEPSIETIEQALNAYGGDPTASPTE